VGADETTGRDADEQAADAAKAATPTQTDTEGRTGPPAVVAAAVGAGCLPIRRFAAA